MPLKGKVGGCKTVEAEMSIVNVDMDVLKVSPTALPG